MLEGSDGTEPKQEEKDSKPSAKAVDEASRHPADVFLLIQWENSSPLPVFSFVNALYSKMLDPQQVLCNWICCQEVLAVNEHHGFILMELFSTSIMISVEQS